MDRELARLAIDEYGLSSLSIDQLASDLSLLGNANFRERYACPFLVLLEGPRQWTGKLDMETCEASNHTPGSRDFRHGAARILPLLKSDRNAFGARITLGRARNNDIVVQSNKVSKLHATFYFDDQELVQLEDMASLNGTTINGKDLEENTRVSLKDGDQISFWHYRFEFVDLEGMIMSLKNLG